MSSNVTDNNTLVYYPNRSLIYYERVIMAEGVLAFVFNSTFLFVLARNKDLFKRKRITYHVANLALADTLFGLSLFLYGIDSDIVHVDNWFYLVSVINLGAIFVSLMAVLFMAVERIVVIKWPFTWKGILTFKKMFVAIFITWITAVILVIIPFPSNYKLSKDDLFIIMSVFVSIAILIANSVIACLLQYEKRRLAAITGTQQMTNCSKEKALKLVIMINIILVVTCLPYAILRLIGYICYKFSRSNCNLDIVPLVYAEVLTYLPQILAYTNFLANPIIYIWRDNTYRKAFCCMFKASTRLNGRAIPA